MKFVMALAPLSGSCCRNENDCVSYDPEMPAPLRDDDTEPADIGRGWQKPSPKPYLLAIAPRFDQGSSEIR